MPSADEVAQDVNAGVVSDDLPGLASFASAWTALTDFVGNYTATTAQTIQAYGDVAGNVNVIGY